MIVPWVIPTPTTNCTRPIAQLSDIELLEAACPHIFDPDVREEIRRRVREHTESR